MAIGIVSDKEFELELDVDKVVDKPNDKTLAKVVPREIGRGKDKLNTPDEIRKMIAELAIEGVPHKVIQDEMKVSSSSVSAYANGAHSTATYNEPKLSLASHINGVKDRISRKARRVLTSSLNELTPERIRTAKTSEIANIAKAMSGIVRDMEPDVIVNNNDNRVQFVMFAPAMKNESFYDAIDVKELDGE